VPNNVSEVPRLLRVTTKCSMVLAAAAPMDRHGYFSLGTNGEGQGERARTLPSSLRVRTNDPTSPPNDTPTMGFEDIRGEVDA